MILFPHTLDRTSTYRVLEFFLNNDISSLDQLEELFLSHAHRRTKSDINRMLKHLTRLNVIQDWQINPIFEDIDLINPNSIDRFIIKKLRDILEHLQSNKLMIIPFLKAVHEAENQRGLICAKTIEYCKELGYYHVRVDKDDNAAAMKNFLAYLKLMNRQRGKYELTQLGKEVVKSYITPSESLLQRAQCDNELCRKTCPADVIDQFSISSSCIQCGLCIKACPYGGIDVIENKYVIDPKICSQNAGIRKKTTVGPLEMLISDEKIFQYWLKELFGLGQWQAFIPGGGEFIDVVVSTNPIWIECKVSNITRKTLIRATDQIKRYQSESIIQNTIEKIKSFEKAELTPPKLYLLCAPESSDINKFLKISEDFSYPTGFISIQSLRNASDFLVRSNPLDWNKVFPNKYEPIDYSDQLVY